MTDFDEQPHRTLTREGNRSVSQRQLWLVSKA
ncbi:hypothetical protein FHS91_000627 [Sphingobium xanthum]